MGSESAEQTRSATSPRTPLAAYPLRSRSRAPEFYGFAALTGTSVLFVLYHLWALLPDDWIVGAGVAWYPSRFVVALVEPTSLPLTLYLIANGPFLFPPTPLFLFSSHILRIGRWQSRPHQPSMTFVQSPACFQPPLFPLILTYFSRFICPYTFSNPA